MTQSLALRRPYLFLAEAGIRSVAARLPYEWTASGRTLTLVPVGAVIVGATLSARLANLLDALRQLLPSVDGDLTLRIFFITYTIVASALLLPTAAPTQARERYLTGLAFSPRLQGATAVFPVLYLLSVVQLFWLPGLVRFHYRLTGSVPLSLVAVIELWALGFAIACFVQVVAGRLARHRPFLALGQASTASLGGVGVAGLVLWIGRHALQSRGMWRTVLRGLVGLDPLTGHTSLLATFLQVVCFLLSVMLVLACLPQLAVGAPRLGFGQASGTVTGRLLSRWPAAISWVRYRRSPRSREYVRVAAVFTITITAVTRYAPPALRPSLIDQLVLLMALFTAVSGGIFAALQRGAEERVGLMHARVVGMMVAHLWLAGRGILVGSLALFAADAWSDQRLMVLITALLLAISACYWYGMLWLPKGYYRAPLDASLLAVAGVSLIGLTAALSRVGLPIGGPAALVLALVLTIVSIPLVDLSERLGLGGRNEARG